MLSVMHKGQCLLPEPQSGGVTVILMNIQNFGIAQEQYNLQHFGLTWNFVCLG